MKSSLPNFLKSLGVVEGLKLFAQYKLKIGKPLRFSFLKHPVYLRKIKSDVRMFEQIFVNKEYDINIPFEPKIIFDLGANVGYASVLFANRHPHAKIYALEPEDNNFAIAQKNLEPYKNVTLIKGAVWHTSEDISVVDKGHGEAAFMIEKGKSEKSVQAFTINEIMRLAGVAEIDILKIDIEGSEKEIFEQGFEAWIPVTKLIIAETHDRYKPGTSKAVFSAIGKYNFSLEISGENLILYNNDLVRAYDNF
jgi:FkbM family methyltransferase